MYCNNSFCQLTDSTVAPPGSAHAQIKGQPIVDFTDTEITMLGGTCQQPINQWIVFKIGTEGKHNIQRKILLNFITEINSTVCTMKMHCTF